MLSQSCAGEALQRRSSAISKQPLGRWAPNGWFSKPAFTRLRRSAFTARQATARSSAGANTLTYPPAPASGKESRALAVVRRRPEDQHAKVSFDAVKPVLDSGRHEDDAAGLDGPILTGDLDDGAAADHVIDLVLEVRSLAIGRPLRPDRKAHAQLVRGQEVDIAMTLGISRLGVQLGNLERFHLIHVLSRNNLFCRASAAFITSGGGTGGEEENGRWRHRAPHAPRAVGSFD